MELIKKLVLDHVLASHIVVVSLTALFTRIDSVILFTLRFFNADTVKAELDRLDVLAKAEVDKEATEKTKQG